MKVVALAGGTGSVKLLRGLASIRCDLTVVANIGDNVWMHGLYICPDIDIAMYTLAGMADKEKGWGVSGDTYRVLKQLRLLGSETWFNLGDRDLATHIVRTALVRNGGSLTTVTADLCRRLGLGTRILPATDDPVETHVVTKKGKVHLQEFWVKLHGSPRVMAVMYHGSRTSSPTPEVTTAIAEADRVVICPANPVTSIGPMLAIPGFRRALAVTKARVVALSPMIGERPYSGPAGKLMKAVGISPTSSGVAKRYSEFLDVIAIDNSDEGQLRVIEKLGIRCHLSDTKMAKHADEIRLARELLAC